MPYAASIHYGKDAMHHRHNSLRATAIASIAAAGSESNPSGGRALNVVDSDKVLLSGVATSTTGATGTVTFAFAVSPDGTNYDTTPFATITLTLSGATTQQKSQVVELNGAKYIKWLSVANGDASHAITNVQAHMGQRWA